MAGLRTGCLILAIETGRYTNTPFGERLCRFCDGGEVEDKVLFSIICPALLHFGTLMFNHCTAADPNFYHYSPLVKTKYSILRPYNDNIVVLIFQMYLYQQSIYPVPQLIPITYTQEQACHCYTYCDHLYFNDYCTIPPPAFNISYISPYATDFCTVFVASKPAPG